MIRNMCDHEKGDTLSKNLKGVPGKRLAKLAGSLSKEDAEELEAIIEDGCEIIDSNEW